jgi:hypothetical protein
MKLNYTIEFKEELIELWLSDNPSKTGQDFYNELNNVIYLGGDCLNAICSRFMGLDTDFYIIELKKDNHLHGEIVLELSQKSQMGDLMRDEDSKTYEKIMVGK